MIEKHRINATDIEIREDSDTVTLSGYAATFNQQYDMGWYQESIDPAAFKRTLGRNPDVSLLVNHDGLPLARTTSGTLTLATDSAGLIPTAKLDKSDPDVQRLLPKVRRGDVGKMSFAFRMIDEAWDTGSDMPQRTLRQLDLNNGDVSIVTNPANPFTSFNLRSADAGAGLEPLRGALRSLEQRGASTDEVADVLTRALAYFSASDATEEDDADERSADFEIEAADPGAAAAIHKLAKTLGEDVRAAALAELEERLRIAQSL